jgi:hypothetical protein
MDLWKIFLINLIAVILTIGIYVYLSICLQAIGDRASAEHTWMAWVPVAHVYLMCRIVGASPWTMLLLLVPLVNIGYFCLLWMDISRNLGRPPWWGLMIFVPLANLILPGFLAFTEAEPEISLHKIARRPPCRQGYYYKR